MKEEQSHILKLFLSIELIDIRMIIKINQMISDIKDNIEVTLTSDDMQLLDAIFHGNLEKSTEILDKLLHLVSNNSNYEYESIVNRLTNALCEQDEKLFLEIFKKWIILRSSMPEGKNITEILLNPKYDKAIIKFLKEGNLDAISLLDKLGYDMFHKIEGRTTVLQLFITHNNINPQTRDFFIMLLIKYLEINPDLAKEKLPSHIYALKEIREYMYSNGIEYKKEKGYAQYVIDSMIKAYRNNNFDQFENFLDENIIKIDFDFSEVKRFRFYYSFNVPVNAPSFTFFHDAFQNNNLDMIKFLIRKGANINSYPRQKLKYILKELNFDERKSLLMISESFSQYKSNENSHILKYIFNKMIVMEVSSFIFPY